MAKGIKRKDLKELREPDEFLSFSQRAIDYAKANEGTVTIAIVAIVLVAATALGVRQYRAWQRGNAEEVFAVAYRSYGDGKLDEAAREFGRVAERWPRTELAGLALVFQGNSYAELGKTAEAQKAFDEILSRRPKPLVAQIAHYNLGELRKRSGDVAGAAKELGEALRIEGPLRGPSWLARLMTRQPFEEPVGSGMKAIQELPTEAKAFVEERAKPPERQGLAEEAKPGEAQPVVGVR